MKTIDIVTVLLVIVGALNWGLVGAFNFDLVAAIFGSGSALARIVYVLVGVGGAFELVRLLTAQRAPFAEPARA
jgi:uncharacterized membrane protein YuzA (DUF378 family)